MRNYVYLTIILGPCRPNDVKSWTFNVSPHPAAVKPRGALRELLAGVFHRFFYPKGLYDIRAINDRTGRREGSLTIDSRTRTATFDYDQGGIISIH
ncbi:hypothetical protein A0H81_14121 [Grifola frondosa]|uniref:Uncharacterized protein n=1 Tax=Grifola frondosa TaxID=5627 RepID=A0A1C7LPC1_GRIFR|nr:hypothetical protein A0H81_14121 [Grifola frondosa]